MDGSMGKNNMDGETADLLAFMDSAVLELQMEMEMFDNKEYERDDSNQINVKDDTAEIEQPTKIDRIESQEEPQQETTTPIKEKPPSKKLDTPNSKTKQKPGDWEAMEPAKIGDQDYSPVSDYSPGRKKVATGVREGRDDTLEEHIEEPFCPVSLEPAKVGDDDYVPVSDYTKTASVETIAKDVSKAVSAANTPESNMFSLLRSPLSYWRSTWAPKKG